MKVLTVNGLELTADKMPSSIQPDSNVTRNAERALDGTLRVDVLYEKKSLEIVWAKLSDSAYRDVKNMFARDCELTIAVFGEADGKYYVESFSGTPQLREDHGNSLYWINVKAQVSEV